MSAYDLEWQDQQWAKGKSSLITELKDAQHYIRELEDALRLAFNAVECASVDTTTGQPLAWYVNARKLLGDEEREPDWQPYRSNRP